MKKIIFNDLPDTFRQGIKPRKSTKTRCAYVQTCEIEALLHMHDKYIVDHILYIFVGWSTQLEIAHKAVLKGLLDALKREGLKIDSDTVMLELQASHWSRIKKMIGPLTEETTAPYKLLLFKHMV